MRSRSVGRCRRRGDVTGQVGEVALRDVAIVGELGDSFGEYILLGERLGSCSLPLRLDGSTKGIKAMLQRERAGETQVKWRPFVGVLDDLVHGDSDQGAHTKIRWVIGFQNRCNTGDHVVICLQDVIE
jgi:hypothetical protein